MREELFSFAVLIVIIVLGMLGGCDNHRCQDCTGFWEGDVGAIVMTK